MARPPTHGHSNSPTYRCWRSMLNRCHNPGATQFPRYGARGIRVCERWRHNFSAFLADMGERPSIAHTVDRFPLRDGDYEPGNCRWATPTEQQNNKSNNRRVVYHGEEMTMSEAIRRSPHKLPKTTITTRLYAYGWSIDRAVDTPAEMGRNQWSR